MPPPNAIESLSQRNLSAQWTESPLNRWTSHSDVSDRLFIVPAVPDLGHIVDSDPDDDELPDHPPQSPTKSVMSMSVAISTTTMAPSMGSEDTLKSLPSLPSLSTGASTILSFSSEPNEPMPIIGVKMLNPDGVEFVDDAPIVPTFECCFWFLNCFYNTHNEEDWKEHCLSHWRDKSPPRVNTCAICGLQFPAENGKTSWSRKMEHTAIEHHRQGHTLASSRPDFELFRYLWQQRLINELDYQELLGNYHLRNDPRPYILMGGRERRIARGGPPPRVRLTAPLPE